VFAVALDALTHPGPADPARFDPATCRSSLTAGIDPADVVALNACFWGKGMPEVAFFHEKTDEEPPLAPYAAS
jgi:hypothetical protein